MSDNLIKDKSASLLILSFIISVLFILVIMVAYASFIIKPITDPLINATSGTDHQAISTTAVSRGYTAIDSAGVVIPIFLVLGFLAYLILRDRTTE